MRVVLQLVLISLVLVSGSAAALSRADIREVQWLLNELGYPAGLDDGIVGHSTTRAAASFRNERRFPGGSSIDLPLLRQLRVVATDQGIALSKRDVRTVQRLLGEAGYSAGSADGVVGSKTRQAAENYRRNRGLAPSGSIDRALLALLREDAISSSRPDKTQGKQSRKSPIPGVIRPATAPQTVTRISPLIATTPSASQQEAIRESSRLHSTDGTITKRLVAAIDSLAQDTVSKIGRPNHSKSVYIKSFVFADTQRPYPAITERIDAELRQKLTAYGKNSGVIVSKSERRADFTLAGSFNGKDLTDGFKLVSVLFGDAEKPLHEAAYWIQERGQNCLLLDDDSLRARIFEPKHLHFVTELRESARRKLLMEWNALDLSSRTGAAIDAQVRQVIATSTTGERLTWPYRSEKSAEVAERMLESALASQAVSKALGEVGQTVQESSETQMKGRLFSYFRDYVQCINEVLGGQNRVYIADAFVLDLEQDVFNAARSSARRRIEVQLDPRRTAVIGAVGAMVARSVAKRVAKRIGGKIASRVAGRAGSRAIPILGWVLLGTEVNDASNGTYVRQLSNEIRDVRPVQDEILSSVTKGVTGAYRDALTEVRNDIFRAL
uniref:Peptidoglycan-binding (PGRP) domain of peptidoglycan hydrolases-containing protein n=1 Tax=Candidatus Kentrum sp. LPFa TaxID=2126335 RepID=A0A450VNB0_9GAMM|nr:MAG: Peptidoglycan-binding (PGRP) domain of peptidoglycan hydrolases-containing protein [Candidatus Kentron sp. LPFa]VFK23518.1 MAG: Peptidoglycan-binding (PGRP) domain of peptidoglycan hydrolases-containing protein [Candidatus Kentron sp. LPFa]